MKDIPTCRVVLQYRATWLMGRHFIIRTLETSAAKYSQKEHEHLSSLVPLIQGSGELSQIKTREWVIVQREKLVICCQVLDYPLEKNSESGFFHFPGVSITVSCSAPAGGSLHHGSLQHSRLLWTTGSSNWELYVWIKGNRGHLCLPYSAIRQRSDCWDQDLGDVSLPHISSLLQAHCSSQICSTDGSRDGPCGSCDI